MRSILRRFLLALWAIWFTGALLEAPGVHGCKVHGSSHGAPPASTAPAHAAHHGHGGLGTSSSPETGHDACTCLAHCCGVSPVALPAQPPRTALVGADCQQPVIGGGADAPSIRRAYARPFANGPPTA